MEFVKHEVDNSNHVVFTEYFAGLGNRILAHNSMVQYCSGHGADYYCQGFEGAEYFENIQRITRPPTVLFPRTLGEGFFRLHSVSTRSIFSLSPRPICRLDEDLFNVAIHIRAWSSSDDDWQRLPLEYYWGAVEHVENNISEEKKYMIFVDKTDPTLSCYNELLNKMEDSNLNVELGTPDHTMNQADYGNSYIDDFHKMCNCDCIISSTSTFAICAGFIGKHKKIIHEKNWVESRASADDLFWKDLHDGGNEDYKLWTLA